MRPGESSSQAVNEEGRRCLGSRAASSNVVNVTSVTLALRTTYGNGKTMKALWWSLVMEVELREPLTDPFQEYSLKSWHQRLQGSWSVA